MVTGANGMTKLVKTTGLAAFTRKDVVSATSDAHTRVSDDGEIQKKVVAKGRKRGKGETVALTFAYLVRSGSGCISLQFLREQVFSP